MCVGGGGGGAEEKGGGGGAKINQNQGSPTWNSLGADATSRSMSMVLPQPTPPYMYSPGTLLRVPLTLEPCRPAPDLINVLSSLNL